MLVIPATHMVQVGDHGLRLAPGKSMRPYLKNKLKQKRVEGVAQVLDCLPSKWKALSSNPNIKGL
jgi:hypothetical protein